MTLQSSDQLEVVRLILGNKGIDWRLDPIWWAEGLPKVPILSIQPTTGPEISGKEYLDQLEEAINSLI